MAIGFRDIEVFRADAQDLPDDLYRLYQCSVAADAGQILRVAKLKDCIIGCYAMRGPREKSTDFELQMVTVQTSFRKQMVGRWLVGHAIGVAESKGGRVLKVPFDERPAFFLALGFIADSPSAGWRFEMIQE